MGTTHRFALPDVGEGLTEAEVVAWRVAVGDVVADGDTVVEVETAKSIVELPSPFAGVVTELLVAEGAMVPVGTALIAVSEQDDEPDVDDELAGPAAGGDLVEPAGPAGGVHRGSAPVTDDVADGALGGQAGSGVDGGPGAVAERESVLVGYGVRAGAAPLRRRRRTVGAGANGWPAPTSPALTSTALTTAPTAPAAGENGRPAAASSTTGRALAKPPVRALARDLGVDLGAVAGSGSGGIVTREDLLAHAAPARPLDGRPVDGRPVDGRPVTGERAPGLGAPAVPGAGSRGPAPTAARPGGGTSSPSTAAPPSRAASSALLPQAVAARGSARSAGVLDVAARETRVPVRGVRRATAEQMVASAFTAPHATAFTTVDVTRTMKLLERLRSDREFRDVHVSPLLMVCRAVCLAVARHPGINATWDEAAQEIVIKHYVNLGIAVATPRGLLVPSVKDADRLPLHRLALGLTELVRTARDGRSTPSDLSGSTISITNIGVFGVDSGTPILNPGEAAILCVGAVKERPWVHKGKIKPRWVADLSVSFDHRLVDGDLGSQFLADVAKVLERPDTAIRWG